MFIATSIPWLLCVVAHASVAHTEEPTDAERAKWRTLAERCGSDVPWCANWSDAAARARAEDKLVLVVFQNYAPLEIPNTLRSGPFSDPDFVALVQERFVPFELERSADAPFRDPKVFGMGPHAFGTDFMFVTATGQVVAETQLFDPLYIDEFARGVLAARAPAQKKAVPVGDPLDAAATCLRRGELELAARHLERVNSARGHRLKAALERRSKHGEKALDELRAAEAAGDASVELELERAVIEMRRARWGEAADGFERVVSAQPASEAAAQARFWLGTFEVLREGIDAGTTHWRELVDAHPESPWAFKAAANLLKAGNFVLGGELLAWPDETLVAAIAKPRVEALPVAKLAQVRRQALEYLLASQRPDGSWWNPDDGMAIGSNLYTPGQTAIAGMALLRFDREDARAAAGKALERVLAWHDAGVLEPRPGLGGTYSIWSRTYALQFLARCKAAHLGALARVRSAAEAIARSIARTQHDGGGWPYVFFPDDPEGKKHDPSASFLTAAVLLALCDARAQELAVDDAVVEKAMSFLRAVRLPEGTFRYMPGLDGGDGPHPEAAGRGPVCALALKRAGDSDRELIPSALACFFRHRPALVKEWHKELCHTGPEGQGSHYLFFDYFHAAGALRLVPEKERLRDRATILADVLAARLADGSFEDMPGLGRAYGTAMALLTLDELEAR